MFRTSTCAVLVCVANLLPSVARAQVEAVGGERLEVKLRIPEGKPAAFKGDQPILVEFILTNPSSSPVQVLVWRTPLKGVTDNIFAVAAARSDKGTTTSRGLVSYIGPLLKRGAPQAEDFIQLAPGESRGATVNLAEYYAIYEQSDYTLTYRPSAPATPPITQALPTPAGGQGEPLRKISVQSNALTLSVLETRQPAPKVSPAAHGLGPLFDSCSPGQQTGLGAAITAAAELSRQAAGLLKQTSVNQRPMAQRYQMWFGAHTDQRYGTVVIGL